MIKGIIIAAYAVVWAFVFFWDQGGWYRVDCSLGVERACDLIKAEYSAKQKP